MNIVFLLRKDQKAKNGEAKIYFYVSLNGIKSKKKSTGLFCLEKNWKKRYVAGQNAKPTNDALNRIKADLTNIYNQHIDKITHIQEVQDIYFGEKKIQVTLVELFKQLIQRKEEVEKREEETIRTYNTALNIWLIPYLKEDLNNEHLEASAFTHVHLEGLASKMLSSDDVESPEYVRRTLGKVKAAILLGYTTGQVKSDAVAKYKVALPKEKPREYVYLTPEELARLESITFLPREKDVERARDLFVIQCYTGLAYSDLKQFDKDTDFKIAKSQTDWDWIVKNRKKTKVTQQIPLLPKGFEFLQKVGFDTTPESNKEHNRKLRMAIKIARINKYIHSHIGRNTLGALLINSGITTKTVSHVLGHSSIRHTEKVYAKIIDEWRVKDEFNRVFRSNIK